MNILLIGQCTLHWGRMEYGNIGNYYIIEPFINQIYRVFPSAKIHTTFQMSQDFCLEKKINCLPMNLYYGWNDDDLDTAFFELSLAYIFSKTGYLTKTTQYIEAVLNSDLVIDFSGDIWGDNANFLGENRFLVGLCKDRVVQLLGKPIAMLAGSPGPFKEQSTLAFAKEVYENFNLVTNREPISTRLLHDLEFNIRNTKTLACPAFLFDPVPYEDVKEILHREGLTDKSKPIIGFILCGWNFTKGPFDRWPRDSSEYTNFIEVIKYVTSELGSKVCLLSHSNGFHIQPHDFKLIHGRDYPIVKEIYEILTNQEIAKNVVLLSGIYTPWQTKAIISQFDMLISGRIHGAVAGLSQHIPTVTIDYGHEPKAHKVRGFAEVVGVGSYVADPSSSIDLIDKVKKCWAEKDFIREYLVKRVPVVKALAEENFDALRNVI